MKVIAVDPWRVLVWDASGPYIPAGILCDCLNMAGNRVPTELVIGDCQVQISIPGEDALGMNAATRASQRMGVLPFSHRGIHNFYYQAGAVLRAPEAVQGSERLPGGDTALIFSRDDFELVREIGTTVTREALGRIGTDWDLFAVPLSPIPFWAIRWDDDDEDRRVVFIDLIPALFGMFPLVRYSPEWVERVNSLVRNAGLGRSMSPSGSLDGVAFSDLELSLRYAAIIAALVAGISLLPVQVNIVVEFPYLAFNHERLFQHAVRLAENARWIWGQ